MIPYSYIPRFVDRERIRQHRSPITVTCIEGHEYETVFPDSYFLGYADCPDCRTETSTLSTEQRMAADEQHMIDVELMHQGARNRAFGARCPRLPRLAVITTPDTTEEQL
jgi:hypothetical protein